MKRERRKELTDIRIRELIEKPVLPTCSVCHGTGWAVVFGAVDERVTRPTKFRPCGHCDGTGSAP